MTHRVLIAGSGVAAIEAVLALRELAGPRVEIDLVAPAHALEQKPASVAAPFGFGAPVPLELRDLADRYGVRLVHDELTAVDVEARRAHLGAGDELGYDHLLIAVGATPESAVQGTLTFSGPDDVPMMDWVLAEIGRGHRHQVAIVVPSAATWTLPAYELAIMTAAAVRETPDATVTLVTAEREPLWIFGDAAGAAMHEVLASRDIALRTGERAVHVTDDVLWFDSDAALIADTVISLPRLVGPAIEGLPVDPDGFLPTDAHGYVQGAPSVLAAGDATTFPVKQGGLATQQADATAATIAHEIGALVEARPFVPILRGLLLTGGAPLYLRAELDASGAPRAERLRARRLAGEVSSRALWWPPGKIAGRYLAPYLATARPVALGKEPMVDRVARPPDAGAYEHEAALDLALLLADEDAAAGDFAQALHALDAAAALAGGVLPAPYAKRRQRWLAEVTPSRA
jgi:sulfide:quinone oxidoreductase